MKAIQEFESLFTEKEYDPALKAIAGAHLFGYYRLIDNQEKSNSVLRFLEKEREMAVLLFPGHNLPSASTFQTDKAAEYMIQIGAFKNRERALKVAGKTVIPGKECKVIPVVRAKRTLYVVRVGYFTSAGRLNRSGNHNSVPGEKISLSLPGINVDSFSHLNLRKIVYDNLTPGTISVASNIRRSLF